MWDEGAVTIRLYDDLTDDPVVTAAIETPDGRLMVMAAVEERGTTLILRDLHLHGDDVGPGQYGPRRLFALVGAVLDTLEVYDVLVVEGAVRTSGAGRGHRPRPLRFERTALARRHG